VSRSQAQNILDSFVAIPSMGDAVLIGFVTVLFRAGMHVG
jgi:hypothetical protein